MVSNNTINTWQIICKSNRNYYIYFSNDCLLSKSFKRLYCDTILGGDLERPFTFLRPTVKGVPGIEVKKINHEDFLAIKSSPTIMYLTKNNWIKNIKGDYGFFSACKSFFSSCN